MASNKPIRLITVLAFLLFAAMPASVSDTQAAPFEKGSRRLSITAGSGRSFNNSYTIIGLGAGYYVIKGLELGLDGEVWLGSDPDMYKVSPQVRYVVPMQSKLRPYGGVFYRHVFIDGFDDQNALGARGGVYYTPDTNWFMGVGAVYESYLDCDDTIYESCDEIYPEITFSLSF
jgi:hypothetical protein